MITVVTNDRCYEFRGLSSDEKPIENIGNGSLFFELDTGKIFIYNETESTWLEISKPGGGGGEGKEYRAGYGLKLFGDEFTIDDSIVETELDVDNKLLKKQDLLEAGEGISIVPDPSIGRVIISSTGGGNIEQGSGYDSIMQKPALETWVFQNIASPRHGETITTDASGEYSAEFNGVSAAEGMYAISEGFGTIAEGDKSHAEGNYSIASGNCAHAEGQQSVASNLAAHAEGCNCIAAGPGSHAEGDNCTVYGSYSHAEGGLTEVTGFYAHAEGLGTEANARASHASGLYTSASGPDGKFVCGKYNINNTSYIFEVGTGTSDSSKESALGIDTNGVAYFGASGGGYGSYINGSYFSGFAENSYNARNASNATMANKALTTERVNTTFVGSSNAPIYLSGTTVISGDLPLKTADVYIRNNKIYSSPTSDSDASNVLATKSYVDNHSSQGKEYYAGYGLNLWGDTFEINSAVTSTKDYVDSNIDSVRSEISGAKEKADLSYFFTKKGFEIPNYDYLFASVADMEKVTGVLGNVAIVTSDEYWQNQVTQYEWKYNSKKGRNYWTYIGILNIGPFYTKSQVDTKDNRLQRELLEVYGLENFAIKDVVTRKSQLPSSVSYEVWECAMVNADETHEERTAFYCWRNNNWSLIKVMDRAITESTLADYCTVRTDYVATYTTYAELLADISKLAGGTKYRVLTDETHNGRETIYQYAMHNLFYNGLVKTYDFDPSYVGGTGINIMEKTISVDTGIIAQKSDLDDKLNIYNGVGSNVLYGVTVDGDQDMYLASTDAVAFAIARRDASGNLRVGTPIADTDAANKSYVNSQITAQNKRTLDYTTNIHTWEPHDYIFNIRADLPTYEAREGDTAIVKDDEVYNHWSTFNTYNGSSWQFDRYATKSSAFYTKEETDSLLNNVVSNKLKYIADNLTQAQIETLVSFVQDLTKEE